MINAVVYARFSSDRQSEMSIDAQVRACKEYAIKNGINVLKVYEDDAISGKSTQRRYGYQAMMKSAKKHEFQVILIHKFDRIARNVGDHINLQNKLDELDIELIAVAQDFGHSKEGKLMKGIQWLLSEYYIDNLSEEVRKGHKEIALKAKHNGGVAPFGYDIVDGKYVINEKEAAYVKKIFSCTLLGLGYKDLIKEMNDAGITGKRGKPFAYSAVYEILRNEKYTGVYIYSPEEEKNRLKRRFKPNAIRVEGGIPQLIDKDTWKQVQKIMDERKNVGITKKTYRCSGLVYCGRCGEKMHVRTSTSKGHSYKYFTCKAHCGNDSIRMDELDEIIDRYLADFNRPELKQVFVNTLNAYKSDQAQVLREFEIQRRDRIEAKQREIDNLVANLAGGVLPQAAAATVGEKIAAAEAEIERIKKIQPIEEYNEDLLAAWIDNIIKTQDADLLRVLVDRIDVEYGTVTITSTLRQVLELQQKAQNLHQDGEGCDIKIGCGGTLPSLMTQFLKALPKKYLVAVYRI